jgi:hypothetical protein
MQNNFTKVAHDDNNDDTDADLHFRGLRGKLAVAGPYTESLTSKYSSRDFFPSH